MSAGSKIHPPSFDNDIIIDIEIPQAIDAIDSKLTRFAQPLNGRRIWHLQLASSIKILRLISLTANTLMKAAKLRFSLINYITLVISLTKVT